MHAEPHYDLLLWAARKERQHQRVIAASGMKGTLKARDKLKRATHDELRLEVGR